MSSTTAAQSSGDTPRVTGWVVMASALLIVAGVINIVNGYMALEHKSYYKAQLVYDHLHFWGWLFVFWGVLQMLAGVLAWRGRSAGNRIGVAVAGIATVLWFFMIFSASFGALIGIFLNLAVVYGLTAGSDQYASYGPGDR
jgi:hypothetical protein